MIFWCAAAVLIAAGAVVLAELASRLFLRVQGRYCVHRPLQRKVLELDPALSAHMEPRVHFDTNALGERGAELPPDVRDVVQVAVIGGSAAVCYLLDQPSSWPERMASHLRDRGIPALLGRRGIHVGNSSQAELTCSGANLFARQVLSNYPDLHAVVLMIGISDMLRWLKLGAPVDVPGQSAPDIFDVHPEGPFGWHPRTAALTELARRVRERWSRWRVPVVYREKVGASVVASRLMKKNASTIITTVPDAAPMLAEFRRNFIVLLQSLLKRPCVVVVAGQPHFNSEGCSEFEASQFWNGGVGDPRSGPLTTYYADSVLDRLASEVNLAAQAVAAELNVPYLELDSLVPSDLQHYYDQFHFTPAGAEVVGRAVAERLAQVWTDAARRQPPDQTARTRTAT